MQSGRAPNNSPHPPRGTRLRSIDQFRGLSIALMTVANYFGGVSGVPNWLKHAPDVGLTPVDLVAPLFIFAIGLTYGLSARRRLAYYGRAAVYGRFVRRYLSILGLGAVITGAQDALGTPLGRYGWGVLQAIGMAGLLALPTLFWTAAGKLLAGCGLLMVYEFLLERFWVTRVLALSHGGLPGALGWTAMLILAMGLADLFHQGPAGKRRLAAGVVGCAALGLLLSLFAPLSKNRVSAPYVLISVAVSGTLFLFFEVVLSRWRLPLLVAWGQNPMLLYVLHLAMLGMFVLPQDLGWYAMAGWPLIWLQLVILIGGISLVAWYLYRRDWTFAL